MSTLSARFVRQPQRRYVCDYCECSITGGYIRLYGNPDYGPMSTLRLHIGCCSAETTDSKVRAALAQSSEAVQ